MRTVLIISTILLLLSCNNSDNQTPTSLTIVKKEINTRDTCLRILKTYALEDTFSYQRFYDKLRFKLSYVRTGSFIYPDKKNAVIIYTTTDSTIAIELYSFKNKSWILSDKKTDLRTSWLMFYTNYADYNFDNVNDIYINASVSNGSGLSRGFLLTVTNEGLLVSHPETREIDDMEPDSSKKVVRAKYALGCLTYKTICNQTYKWVDNKLTLVSKPCKCIE